eukprot:TRINITY_DN28932_c0_g1_i1.p1 TRINITY_DN28932_c0_g1~~TRINITY_DN28932_c0_g1_i1.p1  ORF type:complete len:1037 (+),score=211.26 TRINITY_DN28932_c0_g1_i1:24-3113(+)
MAELPPAAAAGAAAASASSSPRPGLTAHAAASSGRDAARRGGCGAALACGAPRRLPKRLRKETLEELASKTKLAPVEVKALYARFRRLAPGGYLRPEEFKQTMGAIGLTEDPFLPDRMFQVFDADGDGRLDFKEFATSLAVMIRGSEDEKLTLSFEMAAGGKDAIHLEDFQRLIHACNNTMTSLLLPPKYLRTDDDISRLFHDLSDGEESVPRITMKSYKAAARSNGEFLACLGLNFNSSRAACHSERVLNRYGIDSGAKTSTSAPAIVGSLPSPEPVGRAYLQASPIAASKAGGAVSDAGEDTGAIAACTAGAGAPLQELNQCLQNVQRGLASASDASTTARVAGSTAAAAVNSCDVPMLPTPTYSETSCRRGISLDAWQETDVHAPNEASSRLGESARGISVLGTTPLEELSQCLVNVQRSIAQSASAPPSVRAVAAAAAAAADAASVSTVSASAASGARRCDGGFSACAPPALRQIPAEALPPPLRSHGSSPRPGSEEEDMEERELEECNERWWTPLSRTRPMGGASEQRPGGGNGALGLSSALGADAQPTLTERDLDSLRTNLDLAARLCANFSEQLKGDAPAPTGLELSNIHRPGQGAKSSGATPGPSHGKGSPVAYASNRRRSKYHRLLGPKKGLAVHFGHESWNMVLSMMIGIRMSAMHTSQDCKRELMPTDFSMKEKFSIVPQLANVFDSSVSSRVTMTRFIDYAPMVFQRIRSSFGIQQDMYLKSVGPEQLLGNIVLGNLSSLSELHSEGKSGAFFYYTTDGCYMIKTVAPKEQQLLKRMLKSYYDHIMENPGTLIVRFLGLHGLRLHKAGKHFLPQHSTRKLYFVVMANMFNTPQEIHRRYDLKGSWHGRSTKPCYDPTVALKDLDFIGANESMNIGGERREKLLAQIKKDCAFLSSNNIIDYSLLLGIHDVSVVSAPPGGGDPSEELERRLELARLRSNISGVKDMLPLHQRDFGGLLSADKRSLYFVGIIDILTPYDTAKMVEHKVKALRHDWRGVSCCPPGHYAKRFMKFMDDAIV